MGGADKGLLVFKGKPLAIHVAERLAPQVDGLVISANRNLDAYRAYGYPVLTDNVSERLGPLAGLQAGLARCTTPWLVACPCDCPTLPEDLVARLLAAAEARAAALAVAVVAGRMQPTFQLCHRKILPALDRYLAAGGRKVGAWCKEQGAVEVVFENPHAFANFNRPEDLVAPPTE